MAHTSEKLLLGDPSVTLFGWQAQVRLALMKKGLWDLANDRPIGDAMPATSARALGLIGEHLAPQVLPLIRDCTSALQAWNFLQRTYQQGTRTTQANLQRELHNVSMSTYETPVQYITRVTGIFRQLRDTGATTTEADAVNAAVGGLPPEYSSARHSILTHNVNTLAAALQEIELTAGINRMDHNNVVQAQANPALVAKHTAAVSVRRIKEKPYQQPRPNRSVTCFYCELPGHVKAQCPKRESDIEELDRQAARRRGAISRRADQMAI